MVLLGSNSDGRKVSRLRGSSDYCLSLKKIVNWRITEEKLIKCALLRYNI